MRLSAEKDSPHYRPDFWQWFVFVDGLEVSGVVEASEEEGWADVIARDASGNIETDGDRVRHRRMIGRVALSRSRRPATDG